MENQFKKCMMLYLQPLLLLLILAFIYCSPANAQTSLRVDFRSRPPELIINHDQFTGATVELVETLLAKHSLVADWKKVPWPRTLIAAKNDGVDLIPRHSMGKEREKFLSPMLIGYENRTVYYLISPKIKKTLTTSSDLDGLIIGLLRGSFYSPSLESLSTETPIVYANYIEQLMKLLLVGRIDIMPIHNIEWAEQAYLSLLEKATYKKYKVAGFNESFNSAKYLSMPKSSSKHYLYHQLNCELFRMREADEVSEIYIKNNSVPYIQLFDRPESLLQQTSCDK